MYIDISLALQITIFFKTLPGIYKNRTAKLLLNAVLTKHRPFLK
jgi:hypothetical protein